MNKDIQLIKVTTLTCHYESFIMKNGEFVDDMFKRKKILLNMLKYLGQIFYKT